MCCSKFSLDEKEMGFIESKKLKDEIRKTCRINSKLAGARAQPGVVLSTDEIFYFFDGAINRTNKQKSDKSASQIFNYKL